MFKAKIVVVGPISSGKSVISNFLGDQSDRPQSEYRPTAGVRILEFEQKVNNGKRVVDVEVELWDCGGSNDYEGCWPAMSANADGVIIVYNPFDSEHKSQLETWYNYFVCSRGLRDEYCALFAHCKRKDAVKNFTSPLGKIPFFVTNLDADPDGLKNAFSKVLGRVLGKLSDSREREELSIIN